MTTWRTRPHGPLDRARLARFERALPAPLPADYRAFLLEANGAVFDEAPNFDEIPCGTALACLFGLHDGAPYERLDALRSTMADLVPAEVLVVGSDPFGNYFGLWLAGSRA